MNTKLPNYWEKFDKFSTEKAKDILSEKEIKEETERLIESFKSKGYIKMLPQEALKINDRVICNFYLEMGKDKFTKDGVPSPVENHEDSSWMYHSDFCFINVRASGEQADKTGNFLNTLKLIPIIRANSIHLAPFFDCALQNLYAVDSLRIITKEVLSKKCWKQGLNRMNS